MRHRSMVGTSTRHPASSVLLLKRQWPLCTYLYRAAGLSLRSGVRGPVRCYPDAAASRHVAIRHHLGDLLGGNSNVRHLSLNRGVAAHWRTNRRSASAGSTQRPVVRRDPMPHPVQTGASFANAEGIPAVYTACPLPLHARSVVAVLFFLMFSGHLQRSRLFDRAAIICHVCSVLFQASWLC